jgi:hypothetical protein
MNLSLLARRIVLEPYNQLFKFFLTKDLKKITIVLSDSTVKSQDLIEIINIICGSNCEKLSLFLENIQLEGKDNRLIMEALSKSKLTRLSVHLGQNCISYDK